MPAFKPVAHTVCAIKVSVSDDLMITSLIDSDGDLFLTQGESQIFIPGAAIDAFKRGVSHIQTNLLFAR